VRYKHVDNVCTCAVSAFILRLLANLSHEIVSPTPISYMSLKMLYAHCCFAPIRTAHVHFRPFFYLPFKIGRHIWIQRTRFPTTT